MKKGLILTTALAMVLGVGAAVGAHRAQAKRVEASNPYGTNWYVTGTVGDGDWGDFQKISTHNETESRYELELEMTTSSEFKIFAGDSYDDFQINRSSSKLDYNGKGWLTYTDWVSGDNFKMKEAGTFIIYFVDNIETYDDVEWGFGIEKVVEPEPDHEYKYKINNGTVVTMTKGTGSEFVSEELSFDKYDSVEFLKDGVAYEVAPKDVDQLTKVYAHSSTKLVFAEDYEGALYLNTSLNMLWAGQFTSGYYLAGVDNNWQPKLGLAAHLEGGENPQAQVVEEVTLSANTEIKFVKASDNSGEFTWFKADAEKIHAGEDITATRVNAEDESDGNLKIEEAGTYDIYFNESSGWYSVETHQEPPADPVYTVSCRNSAPVQFELDEEDKPEGVIHQYSAEVQYASRAGTLQFFRDGVEITSGIGADAGDETHVNNVYGNTTDGFRIFHTYNYSGLTKIYLKTYSDGGLSVWGDGFEEDEYYGVIKSAPNVGNSFRLTLDDTYEPNETYIKQYKTSAAVAIKAFPGTDWPDSNSLMCAGLAEDLCAEAVAGNNAMQAFQATAWKVHNDCNEIIYLKLARSDLSLHMYIGGYAEEHTLDIGDDTYNMVKLDENQYWLHDVALSAGDQFGAYKIEGVVTDVNSEATPTNNLTAGLKVIVDAPHADIYYKIDTKELYVSGLPSDGQHILRNGHELIEMTPTEDFEEFKQYVSEMETFAANDTIEFIDVTGAGSTRAVVWQITKINEAGLGTNFTVADGKIKCVTACSAFVFMKIKAGLDEVYFGNVPEYVEEAIDYANAFKAAMATACSASGKQTAVEAAWATKASEYAALSKEARDELYLGGYSEYLEIKEFGQRYMGIKLQHMDWELANFLNWDVSAGSVHAGLGSQNNRLFNLNTLVIIIGVVSAISLTTLMIVKRRKHD